MKRGFTALRFLLETVDRHLLGSLLVRLVIVLLVLAPWDLKFTAVSFGPQDLDPILLARAKELGIDLLDPGQWPHLTGILARIAAFALLAGIAWWVVSRLRILARSRFGSSVALLCATAVPIALGSLLLNLGDRMLPISRTQEALPVWGGWVRTYLVMDQGPRLAVLIVTSLTIVSEWLLLLWSEQRQLDHAKRLALSARMAPHFLFNALNTLRAKIEQEPDAALGLTDRLSRVLRRLFHATAEPTTTLQQELDLVEDYLGLEKARLGDRLRIRIEIPESVLEDRVPVLGLQVLVENAVKHGVASREDGGEVRVEAWRDGRHLVLAVADPGQGQSVDQGLGASLENLRMRLARPSDLHMERMENTHLVTLRYPQNEVLP